MAITFRHDAAAVVPPSNLATRKYGQQLVLQQRQQKYAAQQQSLDRLFASERDAQQSRDAAIRQGQQNAFQTIRDVNQSVDLQKRQEAQNQFAQAEQQRKFMEDARKQQSGMIMDDIKNEAYDPATARKLQQNLVSESEALGNPSLDATQRAEALAKIRAERAMLTANRMEKPPAPTAQEQFDQGIVTGPDGMQYRMNSKGDFDPLPKQPQRPTSAAEAFQADPKTRKQYVDEATKELTNPETGALPDRKKVNKRAMELYEIDQESFATAPTSSQANSSPAGFGTSSSAYYNAPDSGNVLAEEDAYLEADFNAQMEDARGGPPPAAAQAPVGAQREPLPLTSNASSANPASSVPMPKQQVKVGGKPLAVSPGTLTPQETEAKNSFMQLPREQRIAALMPYEPSLKGKTLEQLLEDPETKAGYAELSKQGLTTGNYREDMLGHIDEMLQNNVLNGPGSKPNAYVGMNVNEIKDPKAKAEIEKLPRPASKNDRDMIRSGQLYVDPEGVIRARS